MNYFGVILFLYAVCVTRSDEILERNISKRIISGAVDRVDNLDRSRTSLEPHETFNVSPKNHHECHDEATNTEIESSVKLVPNAVEKTSTVGVVINDGKVSIRSFTTNAVAEQFKLYSSATNFTLDKVRELLNVQGFKREYRFVMKQEESFQPIFNESNFMLKDIVHDNAIYVDFDSGCIPTFYNGSKIDSDEKWLMTNYTVVDLKNYPIIRKLVRSAYEQESMSNSNVKSTIKYDINNNSYRNRDIFTCSTVQNCITEIPQECTSKFVFCFRHSESKYVSRCTAKCVIEIQEIEVKVDDLKINSAFYDELYAALLPGRIELQNAIQLLTVLQKYGYYIPLQYTTGNSFSDTDNIEARNKEEVETKCTAFVNHNKEFLESEWLKSNASRASENTNHQHTQDFLSKGESDRFKSDGDGTSLPIESFQKTMSDPKRWEIIKYKQLLPTLLLLKGKDNWVLSQSVKLLTEFRIELQKLEKIIDIHKYSTMIQHILY